MALSSSNGLSLTGLTRPAGSLSRGLSNTLGGLSALSGVIIPRDFASINTIFANDSFSVDWGDGNFINYPAGNASSIATGNINLESSDAVTKIQFITDSFKEINLLSSYSLLDAERICENLFNLEKFAMAGLNEIATFRRAFYNCNIITDCIIEYTNFTLRTDLMFRSCFQLVNLSTTMTFSNATNISNMFLNCINLVSLEIGGFSSVVQANGMFENCNDLVSVAANFNFPQDPTLNSVGMFRNCTSLICIRGLDTTNSSSSSGMFFNAPLVVAPTAAEIVLLETGGVGFNYLNAGACP